MGEQIFALDIGTRSVTGILLTKENNTYSIVDYCMKEHAERSMHDGQIHNIPAVAKVIKEVKVTLEQAHGPLEKVCVAAAGRALKTIQSQACIFLDDKSINEPETISHLELSAVQEAQKKLALNEGDGHYQHYYCVGYSVLHYSLDDAIIGSLMNQRGENAHVDIIATFLPKVVIESLLTALDKANLTIEALTLEPIAAIDVLIPESMRRLNVALVDIGAGTSDIALTKEGTITAYGMVPTAGDEITEAISDSYLLDFPKAEETKRSIVNTKKALVNDILGFEQILSHNTVVAEINPAVDNLAQAIANEIITLNQKQPKAVMLVGGGSLTPNITTILAHKLQLPNNRVAVRGIDAIQHLTNVHILPKGPNYVTTIGIGIAAKQNPVNYMNVHVNDKDIRMFELKQLTVGDCLVQAGINSHEYYGKPGMAFFTTINNQEITLPGEYGTPPTIFINGEIGTVKTAVKNGDHITLEKGNDGKKPHVSIEQVLDASVSLPIYVNDQRHFIELSFFVNGEEKDSNYIIQDNDSIVYKRLKTVTDFFKKFRSEKIHSIQPFTLLVNRREVTLDKGETHIYVNGNKSSPDYVLKQNDRLIIQACKKPTVQDLLHELDERYWNTITTTFNGKQVTMQKQQITIIRGNHETLNENSILYNQDQIHLTKQTTVPFIFQDVFRYVDVDITKVSGHFQLYKNMLPTSFHEEINDGDALKIDW